jgi:hypothetical protein
MSQFLGMDIYELRSKYSQALKGFDRYDLCNLIIRPIYEDCAIDPDQVKTLQRLAEIKVAFEAIASIYQILAECLITQQKVGSQIIKPQLPKRIIDAAREIFNEKLIKAEEGINQAIRDRQRAQEELLEQQAQMEARQADLDRAEKERLQKALLEFHSKFQPVPLDPTTKDELDRLNKAAIKQQQRGQREYLSEAIKLVNEEIIDWRGDQPLKTGDDAIKRLSDTLLSLKNVLLMTCALNPDLITHFKDQKVPSTSPIPEGAEAISVLYRDSQSAKEQIDLMLEDRSMLLPLAAAMLPLDKVRLYYADILPKGDNQLEPLAQDIKKALKDTGAIQLAKTKMFLNKGDAPQKTDPKKELSTPVWLSEIAPSDQYAWQIQPNGAILFASHDDPGSIHFIVGAKYISERESFSNEFSKQLGLAQMDAQASKLKSKLVNDLKCKVTTEQESDDIRLTHQAANINVAIGGLSGQRLKQLQLVEEKIEQHLVSCQALVMYAQLSQCSVADLPDQISFQFPNLDPLTITKIDGFIPIDRLDRIYEFIQQAPELAEKRSQLLQREAQREANKKLGTNNFIGSHIIPQHDDGVVIIPDTAVFLRLAAPVGGEQHWLDLLAERGSRKDKYILIPARVVYEALGCAYLLTEEGEVLHHQLRDFPVDITAPVERLLSGASHVRIGQGQDEGYEIISGKLGTDHRVAIVYTEGDVGFFQKASELVAEAKGNKIALERAAGNEFNGSQNGDQAITELINQFPTKARLVPITTDSDYVDNQMPKRGGNESEVYPCHLAQYLMYEVTCNNSSAALAIGRSEIKPHEMMDALTEWWRDRQKNDSYDSLFTPLLRGHLEQRGYASLEILRGLFEGAEGS